MEQRQEPMMEIINFTEAYKTINFGGNFSGLNRYSAEQNLNYRKAICVINVILCFTTVLGNTAFLITTRKTSLHSVAKILLTNLAVSDLAVGLVSNPLFIAITLSEGITNVAILFNVLGPLLGMVSLSTITAIGVDRLLVLQLHLRYEAVVTSSRAIFVVIFIWVFSGVCSCTASMFSLTLLRLIVLSTVFISLLAGNFVLYLKIYLIVRRHQRQIQQQQPQANNENIFSVKRFKKSAFNTFLVFILLLCCYMPFSVCVSMSLSGTSISPSVYIPTVTLVFLNSSLNPLLYCWRDREIRAAMKQFFRCS